MPSISYPVYISYVYIDCLEPFDGDFTFPLPRDVMVNSLVGSVESAYQQYFKLVINYLYLLYLNIFFI